MSIDLSLPEVLDVVLPEKKKSTISMEISTTTDCPICFSFPRANTLVNTSLKSSNFERKCPVCGKNCGKPALLDLFSGAGGAARGYQTAGFCVLGVDIKPQPHYAGCRFVQADALEFPLDGYDAYHASPPCQAYSRLTEKKYRGNHPDLIAYVRLLLSLHKPFVIENVPDAKDRLWNPIRLCGTMFGLGVYRHRYFEICPEINTLFTPCNHHKNPILVSGTTRRKSGRIENSIAEKLKAMDIDWMTGKELDQAIPPAYTEYIGKYLMEASRT